MSESLNIELFIAGDMDAFRSVYVAYIGRTLNFLTFLSHDENLAEDLAQNTFLQLWNSRRNINPDGNIEGYIFAIARNLLLHEIRSRAVHERFTEKVGEKENEPQEPQIDDTLTCEAIEQQILTLLAALPDSRRRIFMMRWSDGLSNKEIAARLGISEKTVSTQIHRTVQYLKGKIGDSFIVLCAILAIQI